MLHLIIPAVVVIGGGIAYKFLHKPAKPQVPPIQDMPGHPRLDVKPPPPNVPSPGPVVIGTTPAGHPITVITPINPDTNQPTIVNKVATAGAAVQQSHALLDYLKAKGTTVTPTLSDLVMKFQTAHNSDPETGKSFASLTVNGLYDLPTSGRLTVYTGDPIPPAANTPVPSTPPNGVGPAAYSSSNLYAYLKVHGNDHGATLKDLVKRFQHDANTDPQFPGPANKFPAARIIKKKLVEDGLYGKGTSDALAVCTFERINP